MIFSQIPDWIRLRNSINLSERSLSLFQYFLFSDNKNIIPETELWLSTPVIQNRNDIQKTRERTSNENSKRNAFVINFLVKSPPLLILGKNAQATML